MVLVENWYTGAENVRRGYVNLHDGYFLSSYSVSEEDAMSMVDYAMFVCESSSPLTASGACGIFRLVRIFPPPSKTAAWMVSLCTSSPAYSISFLSGRVMISLAFSRFPGFPGEAPSSAPIPGPSGPSVLSSELPDPFT